MGGVAVAGARRYFDAMRRWCGLVFFVDSMASDEENCVRAISAALKQVSERLEGNVVPTGEPQASVDEAAEFLEMLDTLIATATSEERVRILLFDVSSDLVHTVVAMLRTHQVAAGAGSLSRLLVGAMRCLARGVTFQSRGPDAEPSYVALLMCDAVVKCGGSAGLANLLCSSSTPEVLVAAGELLFALLLRSDAAKRSFVQHAGIPTVMSGLSADGSGAARTFMAACLREVANTHADAFLDDGTMEALLRCLALDSSADVRALAAEVIDVVFKCEPHAWRTFGAKKALCGAVTARLEREQNHEVLEATLKLLETLFVADSSLPEETASFTDMFLSSFGDRLIIGSIVVGQRVASLAARVLRLLLQLAPYFRYVGYNLCQHFPSLSTVLRAIVEADKRSESDDVAHQVLRLELALAISMLLAQDPRARVAVRQHLEGAPQWLAQLRAAIVASLNSAALEYFGGIGIIDVTGVLLNDPHAIEWEQSGSRPTRASIERCVSEQELRWSSDDYIPPQRRPDIGSFDPGACAKLTFVILGYVSHLTLGDNAAAAPRVVTSPPQHVDPAETTSHVGGLHGEASSQRPALGFRAESTKASRLREWKAHPVKHAAHARAAEMADVVDPLPRPASFFDQSAPQHPTKHVPPAARTTIFSKFDGALKLCTHYAQFYNSVGTPSKVIYETDGKFARRQPRNASWFAGPTPSAKSWTVQQLKEGDLFYFSIPLVALSSLAVQQVRERASRHLKFIKNSFVITPQAARARRWFLFDMLNHIMPSIIQLLSELLELMALHGDENVKFPMVMFREGESAEQPALTAANAVEVVEQVRFYFKNAVAANVTDSVTQPSAAQQLTSQYLRDVESKIRALSRAEFTGTERAFDVDGSGSDEDSDYYEEAQPAAERATLQRRYRYDSDSD